MDTRPSAELVARWRADHEADLDRRFGELKRQALEDFDRRFSTDPTANDSEAVSLDVPVNTPVSPVPQRVAVSETNGSSNAASGAPTAKRMILTVLPEPGEIFTSRDIRASILQRWPDANTKYLGSRVSQLLKTMLDDGKLEKLGKGERIQDPITYRVKESSGETLLEP